MLSKTKNNFTKWDVSYDPYTDLFQMHKGNVFKLPSNKLSEKQINGMRFLYEKPHARPVLIEINQAYDRFGRDVSDMEKRDIVKMVEPMVEPYL